MEESDSDLKWHRRFLELCKHISTWSKDPSTKVGAVIVDDKRRIVSVGYNGFPRGVDDSTGRYDNRELKYSMVVHGEINAILFANRSLEGCTLYTWPLSPCSTCAGMVIQSGIKKCVFPELPNTMQRWGASVLLAKTMFEEAGVTTISIKE